ncbi:hypothetical protein SSP531S_32900 [Streptomyces spongiicola]|uniref:Uncharacterized protein n=1 Tax=Streptomyces spongiicola TaxID=1690221 RepID=A0A388T137_9ACTN|nr:hypothetical protein SSP531S_32900 [Streptomyces spongiicola]
MPVPARRDAAVPTSLERLCAGGEINSVIALCGATTRPETLGKQPAADVLPLFSKGEPQDIRSRAAIYRY